MKQFKTHKGEVVKGEKLVTAINKVVNMCIKNSQAIREQDDYASHITDVEKDEFLAKSLKYFEKVRESALDGSIGYKVWFFQMLDFQLTGESVALLP